MTEFLLVLSMTCVLCAVVCAALCMWSLHGKPSRARFEELGVDPEDPSTYRPEVLWYFGHMMHLNSRAASERLRRTNRQDEIDTLSYHIVELSQRVFRKHRYINAGWAFTAVGLMALGVAAITMVSQAAIA